MTAPLSRENIEEKRERGDYACEPMGVGGGDLHLLHPTEPNLHPSTDASPPPGPEPVGDIAHRLLDDLATRQAEALARLARAHKPRRTP
jgi:hypothetical protein